MLLGLPRNIFLQGLAPRLPTLCTPSPNSAVREPPGVAVVKAVLKGSLKVPRGCNGGGVETTGLLSLGKGQRVAIQRCSVVEHNTYTGTPRIGS